MEANDFPDVLELPEHLKENPQQLILDGNSAIIGPDGFYELEPQLGRRGIIYHHLNNLDRIYQERMTLDTSGHYQRPDVFELNINKVVRSS